MQIYLNYEGIGLDYYYLLEKLKDTRCSDIRSNLVGLMYFKIKKLHYSRRGITNNLLEKLKEPLQKNLKYFKQMLGECSVLTR